jgi:ATP-dependent RNA helicase RhlE
MYRQTYNQRPRSFGRRFPARNKRSDTNVVGAIRAMQASFVNKLDQTEEEFTPTHQFSDFPISETLKANILFKKYETPTPIQDVAIPAILEGKDLIGIANTGTGKTAAFLIPLIEKTAKDPSQKVLIITPTRELAMQIASELYGLTYGMKIYYAACVGGMNIQRQIGELRRPCNFVIGTPGRLKDLSQRGCININSFNNVVLDEADRMVDMGFIHDIKYFIAKLPKQRQSLFFSATITPKVTEILRSFVKDAITVSVKSTDLLSNIKQEIVNTNSREKFVLLQNYLKQDGFEKVLIFGRTKWGVQRLSNDLVGLGFNAAAIHGNKNQGQRQRVLDDFKKSRISILLATDVASRGIDVKDISHVINYDLPGSYEDYVHRIGRTGRANKKGVALTFVESN